MELTLMPFSVKEAKLRGITAGRLRSIDLDKPFHGVRAVRFAVSGLESRCIAFATRMGDGLMYSHVTAARLWGMPLPLSATTEELHVTAIAPARAPRVTGTVGHARTVVVASALLRGLVVASPADTWADLAETLEVHDLVAVGEHIVTGNPVRKIAPLASIDSLRTVTDRRRGSPGSRARERALRLIEIGPLSRPESLTRLLLVGAGLPHPLINPSLEDSRGVFLAMPDLAWAEYKVALEYEGDDHRSVKRFRDDIVRIERLVDYNWLIIKVSADDLFDRPDELVARVARRLEARGWKAGRIRLPKGAVFGR